jgi:hypothetical protein
MVSSTAAGGVVRALADVSLLQRSCAACFLSSSPLVLLLLLLLLLCCNYVTC